MNDTSEGPPNPPTISQVRLRANRQNAQRSTGPRTHAGKANSRRNATRHGVLTSAAVLRGGPDAEAFEPLFQSLCDELMPIGELERLQVEVIAIGYWRLGRVYAAETRLRSRTDVATADVAPGAARGLQALSALDDLRSRFNGHDILSPTNETVNAFRADLVRRVSDELRREVDEYTQRVDDASTTELAVPSESDSERLGRYATRIVREITWAWEFLERLQAHRSI